MSKNYTLTTGKLLTQDELSEAFTIQQSETRETDVKGYLEFERDTNDFLPPLGLNENLRTFEEQVMANFEIGIEDLLFGQNEYRNLLEDAVHDALSEHEYDDEDYEEEDYDDEEDDEDEEN